MSAEYGEALDDERSVIDDRRITPEMSDESNRITFDSKTAEADIARRAGGDLERAFVSREVAFQRRLLGIIDSELLRSVRSEDQRNAILRFRPMVAQMLASATELDGWLRTQR